MKGFIHWWVLFILSGILVAACQQAAEKKNIEQQGSAPEQNAEVDVLNKAVLSDSLNPEPYYRRSLYYLKQEDINKALADINIALQLNDKKSDYFVALSDIYLAMGKVPNCLEALKRAEELDPASKYAMVKLANVHLILRDYQRVFEYTGKALDFDRISPEAYFIRGYAYMELGDTSLAIKSFQAAADQDQNYYAAYIELGSLYMALKNPLANGYFQTATRIEPERGEAFYLLGMAYQEQENIPKAVETYEKLLAVSPSFKEAYFNLGFINMVYIKDFEKAKDYFSQAISYDPKYVDAFFNRGYSYELMGDFASARKDYHKALEITPNYERSIIGLNRLDSLE
jgi:tetratricopeptide (TPR) repeat protein